MTSQRQLTREFASGATSGQASNVEIIRLTGGYTALVGYGHAVYAVRSPGGRVIVYGGWYEQRHGGYSGSRATKSQFGTMRLFLANGPDGPETIADTLFYARPQTDSERMMVNLSCSVRKDNPAEAKPSLRSFDVSALNEQTTLS